MIESSWRTGVAAGSSGPGPVGTRSLAGTTSGSVSDGVWFGNCVVMGVLLSCWMGGRGCLAARALGGGFEDRHGGGDAEEGLGDRRGRRAHVPVGTLDRRL